MYKIPASLRSDFSDCRFARHECRFASESVAISSEYAVKQVDSARALSKQQRLLVVFQCACNAILEKSVSCARLY